MPSGWSQLSDEELEAMGLDPSSFNDVPSGFQSALYKHKDGEYALAFAGTNDGPDVKVDIDQNFGKQTVQYSKAVTLGQQVSKAVGDNKLVYTGHSLGGGLATTAALVTNKSAVTFNGAGVNLRTLRRHGVSSGMIDNRINQGKLISYYVMGEILSDTTNALPQQW